MISHLRWVFEIHPPSPTIGRTICFFSWFKKRERAARSETKCKRARNVQDDSFLFLTEGVELCFLRVVSSCERFSESIETLRDVVRNETEDGSSCTHHPLRIETKRQDSIPIPFPRFVSWDRRGRSLHRIRRQRQSGPCVSSKNKHEGNCKKKENQAEKKTRRWNKDKETKGCILRNIFFLSGSLCDVSGSIPTLTRKTLRETNELDHAHLGLRSCALRMVSNDEKRMRTRS